jgi:hypothetical protein
MAKKTPVEIAEAKAAKEAAVAAKAAEVAAAKAAKEALGGISKNASAVQVHDANGLIRTYSNAEHGAGFLDLAAEFAGKAEGRTVVAE